jgi:hypothetical protein
VAEPIRVSCPQGGPAPCVDDLCHGGATTLCGLERGVDFCDHGFLPDSCEDCPAESDAWDYDDA